MESEKYTSTLLIIHSVWLFDYYIGPYLTKGILSFSTADEVYCSSTGVFVK